jgi:predicted RecA/RadA family phage recombinase
MINKIQEGEILKVTAGEDYDSGEPVLIGNRVGIAMSDVTSGSDFAVEMEGVFEVTKVSAQAWTLGDQIFWDASASKFTTTGTGNTRAGYATEDAANPSSTGRIKLDGSSKQSTVIAAVATADGSDAATTQALANALKASHNSLLAALKAAGLMANS